MSELVQAWPWLISMGLLVLVSSFFSGSEAALFSLHVRDRRRLARRGLAGKMAASLLRDPERLLSAILFWNLLVNMCYFGIASIVAGRLESNGAVGGTATIAFTVASLLTIIFFSEMLPKSLAVLAPDRFSMLLAPTLTGAVKIISPILPLLRVANLAASRLIWPSLQPEPEINLADIERAIELGTDDAALAQRERQTLRSLVGLAETRAVEVMRPRSRLKICTAPVGQTVLQEESPPGGYLMLVGSDDDMIVAAIGLRTLRPSQIDALQSAAEPVIYVPWSASVAQVLDGLNEDNRSVAVVVNEFGEAIGALTVDDILRDVLAPSSGGEPDDAIREIGPDRYRLSGSVSVRALVKQLGVEIPEESTATVAGHLQRQNERRPRLGDTASLGPFRLVVVDESEQGVSIEAHRAEPESPATGEAS